MPPLLSLRCSTLRHILHGFSEVSRRIEVQRPTEVTESGWTVTFVFSLFLFHSHYFFIPVAQNHIPNNDLHMSSVSGSAFPEKIQAKIISCGRHIFSTTLDSLKVVNVAHGMPVTNTTIAAFLLEQTPWPPPWCEPSSKPILIREPQLLSLSLDSEQTPCYSGWDLAFPIAAKRRQIT